MRIHKDYEQKKCPREDEPRVFLSLDRPVNAQEADD